ncbi:hypothetical protein LXL04_036863 [Taraxacum kok-saghyz]
MAELILIAAVKELCLFEAEADCNIDDFGQITSSPELRRLAPTGDYFGDIYSYPPFVTQDSLKVSLVAVHDFIISPKAHIVYIDIALFILIFFMIMHVGTDLRTWTLLDQPSRLTEIPLMFEFAEMYKGSYNNGVSKYGSSSYHFEIFFSNFDSIEVVAVALGNREVESGTLIS